jgi:hypothetical protein
MVKSYLDELANDVSKRTDIRGWFSHATDLYSDLEKAWNLWDAVSPICRRYGSLVRHQVLMKDI